MSRVRLERAGAIAEIVLDRADKLNAIDGEMLDELERALDTAESEDEVRAIVLRGNGRAFSSGFDMAAVQQPEGDATERIRRELRRDFEVIMRFWDCPKPTVAVVHGYCLGSSLEIAAVCDLTIAADDCRFGVPEVRYGNGIVCLVLPWIIGFKNANELLLCGRHDIGAERALAMGLVNRLAPAGALRDSAMAVAEELASNDALALRLTKEAIHLGMEAAGFRRALEEALEYDIRIETTETPESAAFNEVLEREGLKAALAWRASRHAAR